LTEAGGISIDVRVRARVRVDAARKLIPVCDQEADHVRAEGKEMEASMGGGGSKWCQEARMGCNGIGGFTLLGRGGFLVWTRVSVAD
jgi:hypothetical protein